jgi:transketolase
MTADIASLLTTAALLRSRLVEASHRAQMPHLGSCLSCVDILTAAYFSVMKLDPGQPDMVERDRLILSKGHAAPALFQALAERGYYAVSDLEEGFGADGSVFGEHPPAPCDLPGVEAATGALGHGLPMGLGMAYAAKLRGSDARVYAILGDGECNEGSIWEAAMLAPALGLEQLVVIVDFNKWQATDRSEEVMAINPLVDKWRAFGWSAREIDGHDMNALVDCLSNVPDGSGKPVAIVAHTVKGKGISFMEDDNNWHYRIPNAEEVAAANRELGIA